jgi:hypothetical protein
MAELPAGHCDQAEVASSQVSDLHMQSARNSLVRRAFPAAARLLAATALLHGGVSLAETARVHQYTVSINPELTELSVRACFSGKPPEAIAAESLDAVAVFIDARIEGSRDRLKPSGALSLRSLPDNGCVIYRVDVSQPVMRHDRSGQKIRRFGRDLTTAAGIWLWRPERLAADEDVEIAFDLPEGISVSAPWRPVESTGRPAFRLGHAPMDWPAVVAFGRFEERLIRVGGAQLRFGVLDGSPPADVDQMQAWITDAARMVAGLYGVFPVPHAQIVVAPNAQGREPTPSAYVVRGGSPAVHFFVNQRRPIEEFFDDWTATHELAHLLLPFVNQDDAWLSEGVATYYQNVLRARAGRLSAQGAWSRMHAGFLRGRANAPGMTLAQATESMHRGGNYMRVYWHGAAIVLLADVRLRQLTDGRQSMDTALAALHNCCMQPQRAWSAQELVDKLDELTGTGVFGELYRQHLPSPDFPDLSGLYRELGLRPDGGNIEVMPEAPSRDVRDAIMRGGEAG